MVTKKILWADGSSLTQLSCRKVDELCLVYINKHLACIPVSYRFSDDTTETLGTTALVQGHIIK